MSAYNNRDDASDESDSGTWDFIDQNTQIFDTQCYDSTTSSFGNKCDGNNDNLHALQNTIPFDDAAMCEYELPTQVIDPDCETQEVNLVGETQAVNLNDEHEEMDYLDETQIFNDHDTEEVVVSDHAGSEHTEIVDDSELSDEDLCGIEHTQIIRHCNADVNEYKLKTDCKSEQHTSGVGFREFSSLRAASMRSAGLAARNKVSKSSKSPSCPRLNSEPDTEHKRMLFGKSQIHDLEKVNKSNDCLETGGKRGFGRSTARKLFDESPPAETKNANENYDFVGAATSPIVEAELGGLSYIDSQEPGDAAQANALDFVDDFLKVNIECDGECDVRKSTGGKSKPVLSAKGVQTFAKSANLINGIEKRRIFDWDGNLEDEGGGEFFVKNKDLFFASGSRRLKSSVSSISGRKMGRSESKLVLCKNRGSDKLNKSLETVTKESVRKNLINELDEQSTDMLVGKDIQETTEAQVDTQIAAVVMKDLCLGLQAPGHDFTKINAGCSYMQRGYRKGQPAHLPNTGVRITRSRSKMSGDQPTEVMRAKSATRNSENIDYLASDVVKRTGKVSLKRRKVDKVEAPTAPADQMSAMKQCIQYVTPVARRTRQSMRYNESDNDITISKDKRSCQKLSPARKEIGTRSVSRLTRSKSAALTEQEKRSITEITAKRNPACNTPVNRQTSVKDSSPICMGDEYLKQSCRRSFLVQEVCSIPTGSLVKSPNKDTRQKRDVSLIRVLFSRHLDGDIIKHQKKILSQLGASESSSILDATHFIADDFVRTRNMLEAIAFGKPVVTHLWLESCGQAGCHIDEKGFMLRDAKKEKEFGFSLPVSLARACQNPLLKGHRVFITPNTKPGKEILSSLVQAVHGVAIERMSRSLWNNDKVPEELLILSCEEDYAVCLPFLEKGAAIYSSELLLNGIVTQRLEYERYRLFIDYVRRTRSTIWVKKDDKKYKAVGKVK